ncbi:Phage tail protein [Cupriavidus sp. H19C3]|uniref:phage tail assembly chaperone n=1 Tax=Cupriavidus sp. H19C3 TaxID=3241603 RepID=UPI003BF90E3B
MQKFAHIDSSRRVLAFYAEGIHEDIPTPSVAISDETHEALLDGQATGKVMMISEEGHALLADPSPPSDDYLAGEARLNRDRLLAATDGMVLRHSDELQEGIATTLTAEQYQALMRYRRELRNVPEQSGFPASIVWPETPLP